MRLEIFTLLIAFNLFNNTLPGQTRKIDGRVINEDFEPIPKAAIYTIDTTLIGYTDVNGYFSIEVSSKMDKLLLGCIGMEWTTIGLMDDCEYVEIIMMVSVIYDFMTVNRINRLRKRRFRKLPKKHKKAFDQGLFRKEELCIEYYFND